MMRVKVVELAEESLFEHHQAGHEDEIKEEHCETAAGLVELHLPRSSTLGDVRAKLAKLQGFAAEEMYFFFRGQRMRDDKWHLGTSMPENECLVFMRALERGHIKVVGLESLANLRPSSQKVLQNTLQQVHDGFESCVSPELASEGSGGTYFLKNSRGTRVACFKPSDEEPSAANNPRGVSEAGLRDGVRAGEAVQREVAAFITDSGGFSGVPETIMVEIAHPEFHYQTTEVFAKKGSLQRYMEGDCASDFSPHLFPVDEVHKIGILDLRLLNGDRNDANLLVSRQPKESLQRNAEGSLARSFESSGAGPGLRRRRAYSTSSPMDFEYRLTPIDHGFCMPDRLQISWCDLCWLDWPQARQPFSEATKAWVRDYDIQANVDKLRRELDVREPCLRLVSISGMLLKMGVAAGLCLHDIASIVVRQDMDSPSVLEKQIERSAELANMMLRNARVRGLRHRLERSQSLRTPRTRRATLSSAVLPECSTPGWHCSELNGGELLDPSVHLHLPAHRGSQRPGFNGAVTDPAPAPSVPPPAGGTDGSASDGAAAPRDGADSGSESDAIELPSPAGRPRCFSALTSPSIMRVNSNSDMIVCLDKENQGHSSPPAADARPLNGQNLPLESGKQASSNATDPLRAEGDVSSRSHGKGAASHWGALAGADQAKADLFDKYFFEYLERLLEDVILCVQQHRQRDTSLFRRSSSLHLTSPHRGADERGRCESVFSFFSHGDDAAVPPPSDTMAVEKSPEPGANCAALHPLAKSISGDDLARRISVMALGKATPSPAPVFATGVRRTAIPCAEGSAGSSNPLPIGVLPRKGRPGAPPRAPRFARSSAM